MRSPRAPRVRALSDIDLEAELVDGLVDWLTTIGLPQPSRRLESLFVEVRRRSAGSHSHSCVCEECFVPYIEENAELGGSSSSGWVTQLDT